MLAQPFEKPVLVWVGLGFPRQLNTVADAFQFAAEWCGNSPEQRAATVPCTVISSAISIARHAGKPGGMNGLSISR